MDCELQRHVLQIHQATRYFDDCNDAILHTMDWIQKTNHQIKRDVMRFSSTLKVDDEETKERESKIADLKYVSVKVEGTAERIRSSSTSKSNVKQKQSVPLVGNENASGVRSIATDVSVQSSSLKSLDSILELAKRIRKVCYNFGDCHRWTPIHITSHQYPARDGETHAGVGGTGY